MRIAAQRQYRRGNSGRNCGGAEPNQGTRQPGHDNGQTASDSKPIHHYLP